MKPICLCVVLSLLLIACGPSSEQSTATAIAAQAQTQTAAPTKTPTQSPTLTRAPTSTRTPTATATEIPLVREGLFRGLTSQGRMLELQIENSRVRSVLVDFEIPDCDRADYSPFYGYYGQLEGQIEEGTLVLQQPALAITGTFASLTEISGTMVIGVPVCTGNATITWSASTDFIPATPTPSAALLQLIPDLEISDHLFASEAGSSKISEHETVLAIQGDWVFVKSFDSMFPVPAGWTTVETGQDIRIGFSPDNNLDDLAIFIRIAGAGYRGDDRTSEEVRAEIETSIKEEPTISILAQEIVNESKGYFFMTQDSTSGDIINLLLLFSEDDQGFFHTLSVRARSEDWGDYYPIVRAMVDGWVDLNLRSLGMPLPDDLGK